MLLTFYFQILSALVAIQSNVIAIPVHQIATITPHHLAEPSETLLFRRGRSETLSSSTDNTPAPYAEESSTNHFGSITSKAVGPRKEDSSPHPSSPVSFEISNHLSPVHPPSRQSIQQVIHSPSSSVRNKVTATCPGVRRIGQGIQHGVVECRDCMVDCSDCLGRTGRSCGEMVERCGEEDICCPPAQVAVFLCCASAGAAITCCVCNHH